MKLTFSMAARGFVVVAVVVVAAFGVFSLLDAIYARSPAARAKAELVRVTAELMKRGQFEEIDEPWRSEWSLQGLEDPPWVSAQTLRAAQLDPAEGVYVINFWATWCRPCTKELPSMLRLAFELQASGVNFVFVGYDASWKDPQLLLQKAITMLPKNVLFLRDPLAVPPPDSQPDDSLMRKFGTNKIPETYFVKDGHVYGRIIGDINWQRSDVREYLKLLAVR